MLSIIVMLLLLCIVFNWLLSVFVTNKVIHYVKVAVASWNGHQPADVCRFQLTRGGNVQSPGCSSTAVISK